MNKYSKEDKGKRIDNIPDTGILTGMYYNDYYGTWYEVKPDKGNINFWMIGEPKQ